MGAAWFEAGRLNDPAFGRLVCFKPHDVGCGPPSIESVPGMTTAAAGRLANSGESLSPA
jgi:hypothetical protein